MRRRAFLAGTLTSLAAAGPAAASALGDALSVDISVEQGAVLKVWDRCTVTARVTFKQSGRAIFLPADTGLSISVIDLNGKTVRTIAAVKAYSIADAQSYLQAQKGMSFQRVVTDTVDNLFGDGPMYFLQARYQSPVPRGASPVTNAFVREDGALLSARWPVQFIRAE